MSAGMDTGLAELRRELVRRWLLVLSCVLGGALIGGVTAILSPRQYRSTVVMLPSQSSSGGGAGISSMLGALSGLTSLAGITVSGDDQSIEATAMLRSRQFTEQFIAENDLLPELFSGDWDAARSTWKVPKDEAPTLYEGFKEFDRNVRSVVVDPKTGLVTLGILWKDAKVGSDWANRLVAKLNTQMQTRELRETAESINLLTKELGEATTSDLRDAIARAIEAQVKAAALARVRSDFAFRVIDPAMQTGPEDYVWPLWWLFISAGSGLGLLVAALAVQFGRRSSGER